MGRHSAPDDDEADVSVVVVPELAAALRRGRHAHSQDDQETGPIGGAELRALREQTAQDDRPTGRINLGDLPTDELPAERPAPPAAAGRAADEDPAGAAGGQASPPAGPVAGPPAAEQPPSRTRAPRGTQSTAADLALLRSRADVRARVIAAIAVPFVLYAVVMVLLGVAATHWLIWVWIPMVSAGVLAGLILDAAHRRHGSPPNQPG